MSFEPVEPEARWLGSRQFWLALGVLLLLAAGWGLGRAAWLATRKAPPVEAILVGQDELTPGVTGRFRVLVRDGTTASPIPEARVHTVLRDPQGRQVWAGDAATDATGVALVEAAVPAGAPEGRYTLAARTRARQGTGELEHALEVKRSFRIMLSTDKPLYQPGQVIHMRALALGSFDLRPVAGVQAVLEVKDGKGNKVFKKVAPTSDFGIIAADFQLADQVNTGSYTVSARLGDTASERTVTVERYVLPRFSVEISTDRGFYQPGDVVEGTVRARYTFGEPVARGKVRLAASEFVDRFREFAVVQGETDAGGRFAFRLPLKEAFAGMALKGGNALVSLEATVTDRASHAQSRTRELPVSGEPIRIDLVPESGQLVPGVENLVWVVTSYPDGRPARTTVVLANTRERFETSEAGIARLRVTPDEGGRSLTLTATDTGGASTTVTRQLDAAPASSLLLRPDKALYAAGETVRASVMAPGGSGRAFVDVVKAGHIVLTQGLDLSNGLGVAAFDLPADLAGTLELRAYRLLASGDIAGDTRIVQVRPPAGLRIAVELDRPTYRPGEMALLRFAVTRADGTPAVSALGLSAVDEAVFALQDMRPGLERVFFMLQEELLKPRYEIHATLPAAELVAPTAEAGEPVADLAGVVLSAAAGGAAPAAARTLTVAQKQARLDEAARQYGRRLQAAALMAPAGAVALLGVPFLLYLLLRLVRRQPLAGLGEEEVQAVGKALTSLNLRLVLGLYGLLAAVAVVTAGRWLRSQGFLVVAWSLMAGAFVLALILQALAARRLWRLPAAQGLPFARRLAAQVPILFALVPAAVLGLAAAAQHPWRVPESTIVLLLAAVGVTPLLAVAALAVARACASRQISFGHYLRVALACPLLAAAPLLVAAAAVVATGPGKGSGGLAMVGAGNRMVALGAAGGVPLPAAAFKAQAAEQESDKSRKALVEPARVRRHFPETLLWVPQLVTGADGRAQLEVPLADSITTWRLAASAVSGSGELGAAERGIRVFQDFFVDLDLPVALTQHDEVSVPAAVYSYLAEPQTVRLTLRPAGWYELRGEATRALHLAPREVTSVSFRLVARQPGMHALTLEAAGSTMADAVERQVRVAPDGQEQVRTFNGTLEKTVTQRVDFPSEAIAGASDLFLKVYPGAFSQVVEGLDAILRMPAGCFEQTSSSTYPNVLALAYLRATKQVKPEIELKALQYINTGYQRLLSFEVPGGGFSWFGQAPAHNVLTAYGVLEFADMAKVYDIDAAVLARTATWLASGQRPDGSWAPTEGGIAEGAIDQYQGQALRTTAYIAWALAEAGQGGKSLERALAYLRSSIASTDDAYTLAVAANAFAAARDGAAGEVLARLLKSAKADEDGVHWEPTGESAVHSRGEVLAIETTAIAAQALIRASYEVATAHKALAWLVKHKDSGGTWHSTQATVHALRALLAGSGYGGGVETGVSVTVIANGTAVQQLDITPETSDVLRLVSLREHLAPSVDVTLETSGAALAYQLVAVHYLPWTRQKPAETPEMSIDVTFDSTELRPDDTLGCLVKVRYDRPGEARMTIVDLGVPPGFEVVAESVDALKQAGTIQRYSLTGRQVILYFDRLPGQQDVVFRLTMKAKFPVRAKTPPSTVYQYYEPSARAQARPVELVVAAR
ncbi:MAG TPA: MG2 domain-containing protein [Thermoanaerobaculaceae bacterium]|nr:MG2 domain-containing protein [Thermoanaerobaculaceae bacterium]HRS16443.1 MG2 domain-containing protein [Thermoanaerobaculaceae bacterium]